MSMEKVAIRMDGSLLLCGTCIRRRKPFAAETQFAIDGICAVSEVADSAEL